MFYDDDGSRSFASKLSDWRRQGVWRMVAFTLRTGGYARFLLWITFDWADRVILSRSGDGAEPAPMHLVADAATGRKNVDR